MKTNVLLFGVLADVTGKNKVEVKEVKSIKDVMDQLSLKYPELEKFSFQVFVNKEQVSGNKSLREGDEIALLPPFAGG
jgi:molybdopterin converting factor small subunit